MIQIDNNIIQIIFISIGVIFIIIALFRPKNNSDLEAMIEKMFEDFIMQIDIENEDMVNRIKQTQTQLPQEILAKLNFLEQKIKELEQEAKNEEDSISDAKEKNSANQKYIDVLKLHDSGCSIEEIVEKTYVSHAEVKLILELKKKDYKYV
ncbi:MAG: DUF2802 domain-containing protein [Vulcanibacillus sp.]